MFASSSSIYGDAEHFPTKETDTPGAGLPVRRHQAGRRSTSAGSTSRASACPPSPLRYFTIFGPRQRPDMAFNRFIRAGLDGEPIAVFGDGLQERDFTYVRTPSAATVAAADRGTPGEAYNVAGGNAATVAGVIDTLGRLLGGELAVDHQPAVIGDARKTGADTSSAREELGYRPSSPARGGPPPADRGGAEQTRGPDAAPSRHGHRSTMWRSTRPGPPSSSEGQAFWRTSGRT